MAPKGLSYIGSPADGQSQRESWGRAFLFPSDYQLGIFEKLGAERLIAGKSYCSPTMIITTDATRGYHGYPTATGKGGGVSVCSSQTILKV